MTKIEIDEMSTRVWIDGHEIDMVTKLDVHASAGEVPVIELEYVAGGSIK